MITVDKAKEIVRLNERVGRAENLLGKLPIDKPIFLRGVQASSINDVIGQNRLSEINSVLETTQEEFEILLTACIINMVSDKISELRKKLEDAQGE